MFLAIRRAMPVLHVRPGTACIIWYALGLLCAAPCPAKSPFDGLWKLEMERSGPRTTAVPITRIDVVDHGAFRITSPDGRRYTFRCDGKQRSFASGQAVRCEELDSHTLEHIWTGRFDLTVRHELSPDGDTLITRTTGKLADGEPMTYETVLARVGPGKGFAGAWARKAVQSSRPYTARIKAGRDKFLMEMPEVKYKLNVRFDREYALSGEYLHADKKAVVRRISDREVASEITRHGVTIRSETLTVSKDGTNMVQIVQQPGLAGAEPLVYLWTKADSAAAAHTVPRVAADTAGAFASFPESWPAVGGTAEIR